VVKASVLPELRKAIRESISQVVEDMVEEENALPKDTGSQTEKKPPTSDIGLRPVGTCGLSELESPSRKPEGHRTSDLGPRTSDFRPPTPDLGPRTLDIGQLGGRYLYCVAGGDKKTSLGKIGIEDSEVYSIPYKTLCAVVHDCRAEPYQSEDEAVVKQWVLTHQKVVDAAWETFGTVMPIGFDTIIRGNSNVDPDENMRQWLHEEYENLKRKMDKITGKAEYGVQVFWDSEIMARKIALENPEVNQINSEIRSKPKGLAYMYRQKLEKILNTEMEREADRSFKELYEKIKPLTHDLKIEKTKKAEDKNQRMLLNLSCLLTKGKSKNLGDELEKIDTMEGLRVRFTGPWPPYSFV